VDVADADRRVNAVVSAHDWAVSRPRGLPSSGCSSI
jgi:hypothetical protein